jgi:hypothetical protein
MASRRQFLEGMGWTGMGWAIVPLANGSPVASQPAPPAARRDSLHAVLVDVGTDLAVQVAPLRIVSDGEITELWLREIQPTWKRQPVALAGLTGSSTLFCLEQLAWAHGMRVAFHAEHVVLPSRRVVHTVHWRDPSLVAMDERALTDAGAGWRACIADVFASYDSALPITAVGPTCAGLEPAIPQGGSLLASWIIAPV